MCQWSSSFYGNLKLPKWIESIPLFSMFDHNNVIAHLSSYYLFQCLFQIRDCKTLKMRIEVSSFMWFLTLACGIWSLHGTELIWIDWLCCCENKLDTEILTQPCFIGGDPKALIQTWILFSKPCFYIITQPTVVIFWSFAKLLYPSFLSMLRMSFVF